MEHFVTDSTFTFSFSFIISHIVTHIPAFTIPSPHNPTPLPLIPHKHPLIFVPHCPALLAAVHRLHITKPINLTQHKTPPQLSIPLHIVTQATIIGKQMHPLLDIRIYLYRFQANIIKFMQFDCMLYWETRQCWLWGIDEVYTILYVEEF